MYLGKIAETGAAGEIFRNPRHAYTRALISAAPVPDPLIERPRRRIVLSGDLPSPLNPPAGCRFHTRCPVAADVCRQSEPQPHAENGGHVAACWRSGELDQLMPLVRVSA
jgi:oligopeptide/dipeptide ABC transporter ATP-binding protein